MDSKRTAMSSSPRTWRPSLSDGREDARALAAARITPSETRCLGSDGGTTGVGRAVAGGAIGAPAAAGGTRGVGAVLLPAPAGGDVAKDWGGTALLCAAGGCDVARWMAWPSARIPAGVPLDAP